ncbi:MAG: phosphate acyltransferase PlsX [Rudaea sp.]
MANSPARVRIALDVMGGDYAPREILRGAIDAAHTLPVDLVLTGPRALVECELAELGAQGASTIPSFEIVDAPEVIEYHENPALVRDRRGASIRVICDLVRDGRASACVTMGHTGAAVIASVLTFGRIGKVQRPAVAVPYFGLQPQTVLVDAGAIVDCKPEQLVQFARMGSIYVEKVLRVERPTVALMANGHEENKGNELTRAAFALLRQTDLNFIGNVEGYDLPRGTANVIVMDGFLGNIALKLSEGLSEELLARLSRRFAGAGLAETVAPVLDDFHAVMDYARIGAMPVLGVNGLLLIGHGRSRAGAVVGAIQTAIRAVESGLLNALQQGLAA